MRLPPCALGGFGRASQGTVMLMVRIPAYWDYLVLVSGARYSLRHSPMLAEFHMRPSGTGPLFLAGSVGYLLAVLFGGPADDHWNRGRVLFAGALLLGLGGTFVF